jgi:hypothetical protein
MKRKFFLILAISLFALLSCQNKISQEKEYSTTVSGTITKAALTHVGRVPVSGAVISDGTLTTTSDASGKYSLTVFHSGAFILQINDGVHAIYNEVISTVSDSITKNMDY